MNREQAIETMKAAGKTGEYVTPAAVEARIVREEYWLVPGTCTTVCCLVLDNEFTVIGDAACASPENFIEELGQRRARTKALDKIFSAQAFLLCEDRMRANRLPAQD